MQKFTCQIRRIMSIFIKEIDVPTVPSLVEALKTLSDETRLRLLSLLRTADSLCVCELATILRLPHYSISRHLNTLKRAGLLVSRRSGKYIFYSLATSLQKGGVIEAVLGHLASANGHDAVLREDEEQLGKILELRRKHDRLTAYCESVSPPVNTPSRTRSLVDTVERTTLIKPKDPS